jgi:hypothetical protein
MPLISAQYIMYDMPEDEIIGFWGKRPFIAKRIPRPTESLERNPAEAPAMRQLPALTSFAEPAKAARLSSWRTDPTLLRHHRPLPSMRDSSTQA